MKLRIAIVGCGAIAELGHIPAALRSDKVTLVALVDADLGRAARLAERFGVSRTETSIESVKSDVDALVIATPPHIRKTLAFEALSHGLHLLCEKPLANNAQDAEQIAKRAEEAGRILAMAHTHRFLSNRSYVQNLLQSGELGRVRRVLIEQGEPASWPTLSGYTYRRDMVPGGVLLDEGIHPLDMLLWWFGEPEGLSYEDDSVGGLESNVRLGLQFAGGTEANVRLSRTCLLPNLIKLEGERAEVTIPIYNEAVVGIKRDGRNTNKKVAKRSRDYVDSVAAQLEDFAECIETGQRPKATAEDGLKVVKLIDQCYGARNDRVLPENAPLPGLTW
ncbi:MAG: putative dehydrogenase [Chloroflexi bacterium]|jgi:predicted dehydrogenase|nr:MAG: putative dehydrogenase [Chloroflexota bacterium]